MVNVWYTVQLKWNIMDIEGNANVKSDSAYLWIVSWYYLLETINNITIFRLQLKHNKKN